MRHAHSLVDPDGYKYTGFTNEREFIVGAGYSKTATPDFPISPDNQTFVDVRGNPRTDYKFSVDPMITEDWDNGIAMQMDGPYVNRGDDGNRVSGNRTLISMKKRHRRRRHQQSKLLTKQSDLRTWNVRINVEGVQEGIPGEPYFSDLIHCTLEPLTNLT